MPESPQEYYDRLCAAADSEGRLPAEGAGPAAYTAVKHPSLRRQSS